MGMILSFLTGVFLTWLFCEWRMDREDSSLCRRINDLEFDNRWLRDKCAIYEKTISEWQQLELSRLKDKVEQEKEQCPE
jgi:hypothetical protein